MKQLVDVPFENITVKIPCGYDAILTRCYGDYMKLPDEEDRVSEIQETIEEKSENIMAEIKSVRMENKQLKDEANELKAEIKELKDMINKK